MDILPCPNRINCQLFTKPGFVKSDLEREFYAKIFCDAGEPGWSGCRRYQTKLELNLCPDFVMPDTELSTDEILDKLEIE